MRARMRLSAIALSSIFCSVLFGACADVAPVDDAAVEVTDLAGAPAIDDKADANDLSSAQQKTTLKAIDDICGDTWCEGDYDFAFKKLVCHWKAGTCTLTLMVWPRQDAKPLPVYWRSCKVSRLHHFTDLVETTNGYSSLAPSYYDALTTCVDKITSKLPPPV